MALSSLKNYLFLYVMGVLPECACVHVCVRTCSTHEGQKKVPDPLELDGCELLPRYWELNLGSLEE